MPVARVSANRTSRLLLNGATLSYHTAIFKSLAARKATFLLALILIASPVAGLRPMRAARFRTLQDAETGNANSFALLEMLCDGADEIAEDGFTCSFRQLMLLRQDRCKILERHRPTGFGCRR